MTKFKFVFFIAVLMFFSSCATFLTSNKSEPAISKSNSFMPESILGNWHFEIESGSGRSFQRVALLLVFFETGKYMIISNTIEADGKQTSNENAITILLFDYSFDSNGTILSGGRSGAKFTLLLNDTMEMQSGAGKTIVFRKRKSPALPGIWKGYFGGNVFRYIIKEDFSGSLIYDEESEGAPLTFVLAKTILHINDKQSGYDLNFDGKYISTGGRIMYFILDGDRMIF